MANSIFERAISTLRDAEAEVAKLETHHGDVQIAAQSVQTKLDVLKKNEAELEAKNRAAAETVANARKIIADAEKEAKAKLADAETQSARIIGDAHAKGRKIVADAQDAHTKITTDAQIEHDNHEAKMRNASGLLANIEAKLRDAIEHHKKLKQQAQTFAASE